MSSGPTSHRYISQRLQLHYVDWGNPDAPLLLMIHGGRDHCRNWDWTARALADDYHIICPDLRGHGDSAWSPDGDYTPNAYIYDMAQLIHQLDTEPVNILAHSMGGSIATRYAGVYPEKVRRLISIEGIGLPPAYVEELDKTPISERIKNWVTERRSLAGRTPKRYTTIEEANSRMIQENSYLSEEQAYHLTVHGMNRNEDGTYSWKFDNYIRNMTTTDIPYEDIEKLWGRISCPTLLLWGKDTWASNPEKDGRIAHFRNAQLKVYENAGHWLHHDQFDRFIGDVREFLQ